MWGRIRRDRDCSRGRVGIELMVKKLQFYKQCTYEMPTESGGKRRDTAWIPEGLAKVGKRIYFTETPDELWTVTIAGTRRRSSSEAAEKTRAARNFGPSLK